VVAGRIDPNYFLGGAMRLDGAAALAVVADLGAKLGISPQACAEGIIRIANSIMANAIRAVTVERGRDPRDFTLVSYGGAGAVHAVALAAELLIPRVLIPAGAGTFAAFGMLVTDTRHDVARSFVGQLADISASDLASTFESLEVEAATYLKHGYESGDDMPIRFIRKVDLRYTGQFHPLTLALPGPASSQREIGQLFHAAHRERYGHHSPDAPIEATVLRVTAVRSVPKPPTAGDSPNGRGIDPPTRRTVYLEEEGWVDCVVELRGTLTAGQRVSGPAVIEDVSTTIVLGSEDHGTVLEGGHLLITIGRAIQ
jgi:N-methylhydantoinase A